MARVTVRLYGGLGVFLSDAQPATPLTVDLQPGDTIGALLGRLGVPLAEVGVAAVNGSRSELDRLLGDGDEVVVAAPVSGG